MVAHDQEQQPVMRTGLAWLEDHSSARWANPSSHLTEQQQGSVLEPLAYRVEISHRAGNGHVNSFAAFKELTVMGFYTTEIGYQELDNPALRFYSASPACPHPKDPAHRHLPARAVVSAVTTKTMMLSSLEPGPAAAWRSRRCARQASRCARSMRAPARSGRRLPPSPQAMGHEVSRFRRSSQARRIVRLHG